MKSRIILIFLVLSCLWIIAIGRAAFLQVLPNAKLERVKKNQFETTVKIQSRRGAIFDRNGKELAVTVPSYSLFADPKIIKEPRAAAKKVAAYLGVPWTQIYKKIRNKERRFVWLKRSMTDIDRDKISGWGIRGLAFIEEPKRVYPNGSLLSQVIGFTGSEGQGLEGLEMKFDDVLKGTAKHVLMPRDARGRPLVADARVLTNVPDGSDLTLTIDSELQFVLENELEKAIEKHEADSAIGVILDAQTSEVLALANSPNYDLNQAFSYGRSIRRNRVVTDAFEPGSTMKTFVVAAALKEKLVKPSTRYNCEGGRLKIGNRYISEADVHHKFDWLTVSEILAQSSNVGVAKISFDLGAEKLRDSLKEFGFGRPTNLELPGESHGILNPLPWRKLLLSNVSFGHGIAATPMQIAAAYAALANGGVLKKPYIVRSMTEKDGLEVKTIAPEVVKRVLSPEEAATMTLMLTSATSKSGTGYKARIPGFPVAGKTGTAQKVDTQKGGYIPGAYISSFAGFVPAHEPKFVIYIAVDNPQNGYYGSQVAAPVFSRVAQYAVRKEGLSPVLISEENLIAQRDKPQKAQERALSKIKDQLIAGHKGRTPDFSGLTLRGVYRRIKGTDLNVRIKGQGVVVKSFPKPGQALPLNKTIYLRLGEP